MELNEKTEIEESIPEGYWKSKVGVIPADWNVQAIGSLTKPIKNPVLVDSKEEYVQLGIRSHGKGIFYKEKVTGEELGNKRVFWVEPNCFIVNIVFAWERAIARTSDNDKGIIASHRFPMYKPIDDQLELDYLTYFFKSKRGKYILELASPGGAGRNKTLGQKNFSESLIPVPPIDEQQKISEILSTQDKIIKLKEELIKEKEKLVRFYSQMLLDYNSLPFKKLMGFEEPWKSIEIKELFSTMGGTALESEMDNESDYHVISIGNYSIDGVYIDDGQRIKLNNKTKEKLLLEDDLVMVLNDKTKDGKIIGSTILIDSSNKYIFNQRSQRLRCNDIILPKFAWLLLNSKHVRREIYSISQGGTQIYVNFSAVEKLSLKIPTDKKEQKKIVDILSSIINEIEVSRKELLYQKQHKRALMNMLLTGKIRTINVS